MNAVISERNISISWSGIFAGVIMAVALASLFNLLGVGLGIASLTTAANPTIDISVGFIGWILLSSIIPLIVGGWMAARLSNFTLTLDGVLHGLITWALATFMTFVFMTSTSGLLLNSATNLLSHTVSSQVVQKNDVHTRDIASETLGNLQNVPNEKSKDTNIQPKHVSIALASITIITFLGFIAGAIASVVGGVWGIKNNAQSTNM